MSNIKPLTVTVLTDTHYYSEKSGTSGKAYDFANAKSQKLLKGSREVLEAAFRQIKKDDRTDIVLLSGDTTNNGELAAHEEFIEMLRDLKKSGKRVYVITATHDYQGDGTAEGYDGDNKIRVPAAKREDLFDMYREFGPDEAIAVHRQTMSYVVQLADGYRLFALNDDSNLRNGSGFPDDCVDWIVEQAEDARKNNQFIIAMTHHPMIAPSPIYEIIGSGDMQGDYKVRREQFADLGIQFMLTGHTHVHDIDKYISERGNYFYDIATAATIGYPATMRSITFDAEKGKVDVKTDFITEKVDIDTNGLDFQDFLKEQLIGMVRDVVKAAGEDIDTFADMATAMSIKKKLTYKIGWLIKYPARWLNKLTIGTVGNWTRKETGLKKSDYAAIKDKKVVDFICDLVVNLYGGESLYPPETPEYKITIGLLNIIDSIMKVLHINFRKFVKVVDNTHDLVEPLLYNNGIPSYDTVLDVMPVYDEGHISVPVPEPEKPQTVKESKKGLPIIIIAILILILLIPFLPIIAVIFLIGYLRNQIKYGDYIKGIKQ
ncbi:MAG: metallophosphoesterase [Ruminococcaceae bacterium]|nr:metallophosphoesterase [Oscillospiraceae bacterium]